MAQLKTGVVISNKMQSTVVVKVVQKIKHPLYKKLMTRSKKIKAQDEIGVSVGDKVKIIEVKPVSKTVHFKIKEVIKKDK